jgi:CRISPR-associated endonuclease/helicase Cas3
MQYFADKSDNSEKQLLSGQMQYFAHKNDNGDMQLLSEHLTNTASLACGYSIDKFKNCAALCGILHDIGKYQPSFQLKLEGKNISVEHSVCGAKEISKLTKNKAISVLFGYIIAGHHSGLPDYGSEASDEENSNLCARLKRKSEDYSAYKAQLPINVQAAEKELFSYFATNDNLPSNYEFLIRYLFSCLVDADFLDTEEFCVGKRQSMEYPEWDKCCAYLSDKINSFVAQTKLQKSRAVLQRQAFENIKNKAFVYLLDMPTGSGKTICSLKLALERLRSGGKKRIIYIVPYTSIIEQTAKIFKDLFNKELFPNFTILEHHSNFDFEQNDFTDDGTGKNKLKLAAENWDAPFIITTNVQFFESIYSNRSSRLRKLHNMSDSILVFDEIHTLPMKYFAPCIKAVDQLTANFNSEAIFLSATMPDFQGMAEKYIGRKIEMCDLLPDKRAYDNFVKCRYTYCGDADIIGQLKDKSSTLIIFNTKRATDEYYNSFSGGKKYYLSTYMTPKHRFKVLDKIREDLLKGEKIVVFSTSLIEAGVDIDFECVYRELTGVDSILQAGGRCNREGKRSIEESFVFIFTDAKSKLKGELAVKADITKGLIEKYGAENINSQPCLKEYFDEIYRFTQQTRGGEREDINNFYRIDFKEIAQEFKFIDNSTVSVVIPNDEINSELEKLKLSGFANRRALQQHSASVNFYELNSLIEQGVVAQINGVYVLQIDDYYSKETGLCVNKDIDLIY